MEERVLRFLEKRCDWSYPILVGLSGGPDSIALLHLLLHIAQVVPLKLGVAHVDHRWRLESESEACHLQHLVESFHLPFHLKVLDPTTVRGNLEAACRHLRYRFFAELAQAYGYQAVVLGHHQDDQVETILKRIFEGASLAKLQGMQKEKKYGDLTVWRPLLGVDKKAILDWLSKRNLSFFVDRTNLDPAYLRGKMRSYILPHLSKEFGKEIKSALLHVGQESEELQAFLEEHLSPYLKRSKTTPLGAWIDLANNFPSTFFELKQLLRYFFRRAGVCFSRAQIEAAGRLVKEKRANRCLETGSCKVQFDRGSIFIPQKLEPNWKAAWEFVAPPLKGLKSPDWRDAWHGKICAVVPWDEHCWLGIPKPMASNWLNKWWATHKVPAFFRWKVPVVWQGQQVVHEFLSGKMRNEYAKMEKWAKVTLECSS